MMAVAAHELTSALHRNRRRSSALRRHQVREAAAGQRNNYWHSVTCENLVSHSSDMVAPEFRAAAEKRRAEQLKQMDCAHKADEAKVLPRNRMAFLQECLAEH